VILTLSLEKLLVILNQTKSWKMPKNTISCMMLTTNRLMQ
jgi:hypothetical protein